MNLRPIGACQEVAIASFLDEWTERPRTEKWLVTVEIPDATLHLPKRQQSVHTSRIQTEWLDEQVEANKGAADAPPLSAVTIEEESCVMMRETSPNARSEESHIQRTGRIAKPMVTAMVEYFKNDLNGRCFCNPCHNLLRRKRFKEPERTLTE
ncbi:hypothetical protein GQX74_000362 [Glossina fuscipes]|nr:hypothetical protein GQX74_000362 [Glossina fuscipes]